MRSQKNTGRSVYNHTLGNETNQSSTNGGDLTSYIGKILTINHHQVMVEDILGQGGFAYVFLVRSYNQQRYALKRMYVNNQRDLNVCQREISLVKEFSSHPNIVKYIDSSIQCLSKRYYEYNNNENRSDDDIYEILLLTEYCSNGSLITRLNEQRNVGITLNERQILRIFADICNAVSACHYRRPQPILHRDIKLENILIDSHQNYVLCDFGSSILLSSTSNDYQQYPTSQLTTQIIQQLEEDIQRYTTLSYRAPEMIDLYSRLPITLKTDIWAMGCLLYKLMYNTMPFAESILAIQNGTFVIPDDMLYIYSRQLNLFVRYMLEIDINKRPDIWQVSYLTYKFLGIDCPIPNRCQSKIPDLNGIIMPLTDSESRQQRTTAISKSKSSNLNDDSLSLGGTAVNPRERPRGMIAPSTSLINFNQSNQQSPATVIAPPPASSSSANPTRSGSAAQLMFDDDFCQIPSHAISLTNIPTVTKTPQISSRVRPSPPIANPGLPQQFFPPPPPSSASSSSSSASNPNIHIHRRSSSQIISPTNNQSSFVDLSNQNQRFSNEQISTSKPTDDTSKTSNNKSLTEESKDLLLFPHEQSINPDESFDPIQNDDNKSNPFLQAPFHHSPTTKQTSVSTFDPNSIVIGKRTSAFTPYQKADINKSSISTDVFTNAPFKTKSKTKQQTKSMLNEMESNTMMDEYF